LKIPSDIEVIRSKDTYSILLGGILLHKHLLFITYVSSFKELPGVQSFVIHENFISFSGNYLMNIVNDYKTVFVEIGQDMKRRPIKSSIYISLLTTGGVMYKTNPGAKEFHARLTESVTELMLVSDLIRNPSSAKAIDKLVELDSQTRLRCYSLGLFSIMCVKHCSPEVGLYASTCKYLKPHWTEFHKTIVDVGVFGRWIYIEKAMEDYDINSDEWMEDGTPNKNFSYNARTLVTWDLRV